MTFDEIFKNQTVLTLEQFEELVNNAKTELTTVITPMFEDQIRYFIEEKKTIIPHMMLTCCATMTYFVEQLNDDNLLKHIFLAQIAEISNQILETKIHSLLKPNPNNN